MTLTASPVPSRVSGLWAGLTLSAQFVLIWTTFFILSSAIDWPASLDDPAAIALPRLLENKPAVLMGYASYLAAALLLVPATAALNGRLGLSGPMAGLNLSLATFAALAKAIGISRWLFVMPALADAYNQSGAATGGIDLLFSAINAYAGGIGEVIGVGLVSGLWSLSIAVSLWRVGGILPTALAGTLGLTGLGLFLTIPAGFGMDLGPVLTLTNIAWQFALFAIGLWALTPVRPRH
ncbi:DUF4386 family protein [Brevundimonas sp.]|uniref:DUF4386 family protein n=1 Tax=Brevundimonas sp. TaxID=1871086 RepID=UPI00262B2557|nr:DUF4386 family protein [Brevundimonas sp.]